MDSDICRLSLRIMFLRFLFFYDSHILVVLILKEDFVPKIPNLVACSCNGNCYLLRCRLLVASQRRYCAMEKQWHGVSYSKAFSLIPKLQGKEASLRRSAPQDNGL